MNKLVKQYPFDTTKCQKMTELIKAALATGVYKVGYSIVLGIKVTNQGLAYYEDSVYLPDLWDEARRFMAEEFPDFVWNQIYIHVNYSAKPHKDVHVTGKVLVVAWGDYEGGELVIEDVPYVTKDKLTYFEGSKLKHWNTEITSGLKISFCCITDGRCPIYNE